ncbi:hypothetical protein B4088_4552 [Bacillus cereus]|uniref:Uncharacterized protein n=1 Tax=Bacillus cereus TaxID=1396 RepID=A0A164M9M1_BACCE|nr:hypothetical protein B4088_4552 [Bacillus cereus]
MQRAERYHDVVSEKGEFSPFLFLLFHVEQQKINKKLWEL